MQEGDDGESATLRARLDPEEVARHARKRFGDHLPEGLLLPEEYRVYERLYGKPLVWTPEVEMEPNIDSEQLEESEAVRNLLLRETRDGTLEEVDMELEGTEESEFVDGQGRAARADSLADSDHGDNPNAILQQDMKRAFELQEEEEDPEDIEPLEDPQIAPEHHSDGFEDEGVEGDNGPSRTHPFTLAGRSGTNPSTIQLPKDSITGPTSVILADVSNSHLDKTSERVFGGPGLPYSTGTPLISRTMPQKPIPLSPYQSRMQAMEADSYIAVLMPGLYASVTGVLVECRRRLGSQWLASLLQKEGGPNILDAGAGGAGVLAFRDVLRAEHARLLETDGSVSQTRGPQLGKATVLTASSALRERASVLLDNTTFLPRLPDYVHVTQHPADLKAAQGMPHGRKSFDVILAPHSLWPVQEDWQRKEHVQNLWSMLNPEGGVLVLLEKGVPRGFEVVAGARQYLLNDLMVSDPSKMLDFDGAAESKTSESSETGSGADQRVRRSGTLAAPGAIIAPCTTHAKCPMYNIPGVSLQRKDYCHFSQRYIRPSYLQRILGAKSRNYEDVEYSYVAVQKGVHPERLGRLDWMPDRPMGKAAADRAFAGYDVGDSDLVVAAPGMETTVTAGQPDDGDEHSRSVLTTPIPPSQMPDPLTMPRLILPPLKRHGHVMLDVCTPGGELERWTVPRSYGRQAYRDARKAIWGDLWALGAKLRVSRKVRVGKRNKHDDDDAGAAKAEEANAMPAWTSAGKGKVRGRLKARSRKRAVRQAMRDRAKNIGDEDL